MHRAQMLAQAGATARPPPIARRETGFLPDALWRGRAGVGSLAHHSDSAFRARQPEKRGATPRPSPRPQGFRERRRKPYETGHEGTDHNAVAAAVDPCSTAHAIGEMDLRREIFKRRIMELVRRKGEMRRGLLPAQGVERRPSLDGLCGYGIHTSRLDVVFIELRAAPPPSSPAKRGRGTTRSVVEGARRRRQSK
jgi:hypothetical protein